MAVLQQSATPKPAIALGPIFFDPDLTHVLGFRHLPRERDAPDGNVWDRHAGLRPDSPAIAARIVQIYFPMLVPEHLRRSPIKRSRDTLALLWPALAEKIQQDDRLGVTPNQEPEWAKLDQAGSYAWTVPQMLDADGPLVFRSGRSFLEGAWDLASATSVGGVSAMCSHCPYADIGTMLARQILKIGGLLDENFASGAFVHLKYDASKRLVGCKYYGVPPADAT